MCMNLVRYKIRQHFKEQFADPGRTPVKADNDQRPLDNPVTADEIQAAFAKLCNGQATELLKYGAATLAQPIADLLNYGFETGDHIHRGEGILLGLPKPNKPAGQCASLRPIVLLNSIRKAVSLIALKRISPKVEVFLSPYHSGFRPSRSTVDAVWTHRWIAARAQTYPEKFYILGIDMSRAFDTIDHDKLLSVLRTFLTDDEIRLICLLLQDTTFALWNERHVLSPFMNNTGTPQGDSLSPVLFVVYLEAALRDLANELDLPRSILQHMIVYRLHLPQQSNHREDSIRGPSHLSTVVAHDEHVQDRAHQDQAQPKTPKDRKQRAKREAWRTTRKLGSLLGDSEDLSRRKNLAAAALHRNPCSALQLLRAPHPALQLRALTNTELVALESFHRKQLRKVIGIVYPCVITNKALYERTETEPLRFFPLRQRWRLFGHILRRPTTITANRFMEDYFQPSEQQKFRGRPRTTLPVTLDADLRCLPDGHRLTKAADLILLRCCARDGLGWKRLTQSLIAYTPYEGERDQDSTHTNAELCRRLARQQARPV
ncbi:EndonucleaseReverse transcriptase [Phytophthora palmivora]|uniref:EndonucleaseReverse transcriptase n=1 Tax=Phytophthora palmivora TaxID=4796 RepID=A0A2P4X3A1_9STRA|nr:EndonucleaseReverse transcriptase [Phytophthora palmivora]